MSLEARLRPSAGSDTAVPRRRRGGAVHVGRLRHFDRRRERPGALRPKRRRGAAHRQHHQADDRPGGGGAPSGVVRRGHHPAGVDGHRGLIHVPEGGGAAHPGGAALRPAAGVGQRRGRGHRRLLCRGQRDLRGLDEREGRPAGDGAQPFHQPQRPERGGALLHRRRHGPPGPGGAGARDPGPHRQHPIRLGGRPLPHQPQQAAVAVRGLHRPQDRLYRGGGAHPGVQRGAGRPDPDCRHPQ